MKVEKPVIVLDDRAKDVGLAVMLADLIRQNLEQNPKKRKDFNSLNANVAIEARDIQVSISLKFEQGRLIISKDSVFKPDLHIITDAATVLNLCLIKIKCGLPYFFDTNGFDLLKKLFSRELILKGLLSHFGILVKLTKVFSVVRD